MLVSEISHINSGYTARRRLETVPMGGTLAVQLRDVHRQNDVRAADLYRYRFDEVPDRHLVRGGEVIFKSRGVESIAVVVDEALDEPAVVLLPLIVLRPNRDRVLPRYLAWAINQYEVQRRLGVKAQGTSIRMVPKRALKEIDVPLPALDTQHKIAELHKLVKLETAMLHELARRREQLASIVMMDCATRGTRQKGSPQ